MVANYQLVIAVLICIVSGACGPAGPEMGRVNGVVTLDGTPVPEGTVQFWPKDGRPARGSITEDGSFVMTTFDSNDGALVGEHRVTIKATRSIQSGPKIKSTAAEISHFSQKGAKRIRATKVDWLVPEKYSDVDTTPLTATVENGSNEIDFQIEKESR